MNRERGTTTVEFAIVGAVFLVLLFGIIEFARAWFVWNTLNEAARRGARVAVVCPVNHSAIADVTVYYSSANTGSPVVTGITTDHVDVDYLDASGTALASPTIQFNQIRYVRVRISGYQHQLLIPFFFNSFTAPDFETVLPRESLGVPREDVDPQCFGTPS